MKTTKNNKFHTIMEAFDKRLEDLFAICNGRTVVLWGYGYSGHCLEGAFRRRGKQIEVRMDVGGNVQGVWRPAMLSRLDPQRHIILLTFPPDDDLVRKLESAGFRCGESYVPVISFFYGPGEARPFSSFDWMEYQASIDIRKSEMGADCEKVDSNNAYEKGPDYALLKVLDNFAFRPTDCIFDYGCGKGAAFVQFERIGVSWGGIEYDQGLYETCIRNLKTLGLPTETVVHGDASTFDGIDDYDYFYCYNSFIGETFSRTIAQMEASWKRRPRRMTFIYSNPFCHDRVIEHDLFHLTKMIPAGFYIPEVYVYQIEEK